MSREVELRPKTLDQIIGQDVVKQQLHIEIQGSKARDEPLGHVLLSGRPGLGKTTFAQAIAADLGKPIIYADGPSLDKAGIRRIILRDLAPAGEISEVFRELGIEPKSGGVLLTDEIHAIPRASFECLYTLMEDFIYEGQRVEPFTLIGATTDPGKLPMAFRSRFLIPVNIDYYDEGALTELLIRSYQALEEQEPTDTTLESLQVIAKRSRGTPRLANNLLRRVRNVQSYANETEISTDVLRTAMQMMGIDRFGLDEVDRKVLFALSELDRPASTRAIASKIGVTPETVEEISEPWLVRKGYVERGQRGRSLTADGFEVATLLRLPGAEGAMF